MMAEGKDAKFSKQMLFDRVLEFGVRMIVISGKLPKTPAGFEIGSQLVRAGTSIGANTQEAQGASSRKDFINKMRISLKEAKESKFWLMVIGKSKLLGDVLLDSDLEESDQICAIYSAIVRKADLNGK